MSSPQIAHRLMLILVFSAALCSLPTTATPERSEHDCGTSGCHPEPSDTAFPHKLVREGNCVACHQPGVPGGTLHPEVAELPQAVSGTAVGEVSLSTNRQCLPCHAEHQLRHSAQDAGGDCVDCHDPHGGNTEAQLLGSRGESCLSCHAKAFGPSRSKRLSAGDEPDAKPGATEITRHGTVEEDDCFECHLVHTGSAKGLLRGTFPVADYATYDRSIYSACFASCHPPELIETERTTSATRFRNGDNNLHFRHVAAHPRGRSCRLCHAPHRARNSALVRGSMPFGKEQRLTLEFSAGETGGRCETSCHVPIEYDREVAIPSRMRVLGRASKAE